MSVPSGATLGDLVAGRTTTSAVQSVTVSSNQNWGMRIASDASSGRLREWTGSAYPASPAMLSQPMQWALTSLAGVAVAPTWANLSSSPATVVSGRPATGCVLNLACATETVGVQYRQAVSFADRRLGSTDYRILVTYTAQHGL